MIQNIGDLMHFNYPNTHIGLNELFFKLIDHFLPKDKAIYLFTPL